MKFKGFLHAPVSRWTLARQSLCRQPVHRPLETRSPDTSNSVQPSPIAPLCTVVRGLGDPLGQLFLITSPLDLNGLLDLPGNPLGIVRAEVDQLLNLGLA